MAVFVDVECFRPSSTWIIKEFAWYSLEDDQYQSFCIMPSRGFHSFPGLIKKKLVHTSRNIHGIHWDEGDISMIELCDHIEKLKLKYKIFYANGKENCIFLKDLFHREFNDVGVELPERRPMILCQYHISKSNQFWRHCSLNKCEMYRSFLKNGKVI